MIAVEHAREARRFLEEEGYTPRYNEYSMAHEINQDVLNDLVVWVHEVLEVPSPGPDEVG
jgi:predicted esterase